MKEFKKKIDELRERLDFEHGTAQKNKTLLLTLKELCQTALAETEDPVFKQEIQKELAKIEEDMSKIRGISHESMMGNAQTKAIPKNQNQIFTPLRPTKEALTSIQAGGFDPSSSPILRKLANKSVYSSKLSHQSKKSSKTTPTSALSSTIETHTETLLESTAKSTIELEAKREMEIKKESIPITEPTSTSEQPLEQNMKNTEEQIKHLQSTLSQLETKPFPGFPTQEEKAAVQDKSESTKSKLYQQAKLIISQLEAEIRLDFIGPEYRIGRELFTSLDYPLDLPANFFDPILPISDATQTPSEHCMILQPKKGKFILKDPANLQKTYIKGQFLNAEGVELKPGDSFILPVLVNDSLASLSVEFQPLNY
ncbi:MAG: FHA domain-containing protein [Promethearchaeota archaeon]